MDDLASRRKELYRVYDEAALRILMDRYGEAQGDRLLEELCAIPEEELSVPAGEVRAVEETLALCAQRKRRTARRRAALRACGKAAAVLLVLGSLAGYASFTVSAHQEQQAKGAESSYAVPAADAEAEAEKTGIEKEKEDRTDEEEQTAG